MILRTLRELRVTDAGRKFYKAKFRFCETRLQLPPAKAREWALITMNCLAEDRENVPDFFQK